MAPGSLHLRRRRYRGRGQGWIRAGGIRCRCCLRRSLADLFVRAFHVVFDGREGGESGGCFSRR